jgi:hypothetical protein
MVAPRGTRLTIRTPLINTRRSRYSPGSTSTEPPGGELASAAAIDSDGVTTISPRALGAIVTVNDAHALCQSS